MRRLFPLFLFLSLLQNSYAQKREHSLPDTTIYKYVDEMPSFPEGDAALYRFLAKNVSIPAYAVDSGFTGSYYVTFIVDADGNVTNARIEKGGGSCKTCDNALLFAINSLPAFTPGKNKGLPVRVSLGLPVRLCPLR